MCKTLGLIIAAIILMALALGGGYILGQRCNATYGLYRQPNKHSALIKHLSPDTPFVVIRQKGKWFQIGLTENGYTGWAQGPAIVQARIRAQNFYNATRIKA